MKTSSDIVAAIFFETHDGKNAVTNYSEQYPNVRQRMEKLYNTFGFDVLYDKIVDENIDNS
jgi:hypothetical protein